MQLASQTNREALIAGPLADDVLLFREMHGSEELGRLFEWRVKMLSTKADIKIADVLGKSMSVVLTLPDDEKRHFNGLVTRFVNNGWSDGFASYEAVLRPAMWLLTRSSDCRIFQNQTVIDIVKAVCGAGVYAGLITLSDKTTGTFPQRPYCVQYRETDFNFVCRLLEEEGIYYYFTHEAAAHTVVLADSYSAHEAIAGYGAVKFKGEDAREVAEESVTSWSPGGQIEASVYALNDFDFDKTAASQSGGLLAKSTLPAAFDQPSYEQYDYPGAYIASDVGKARARGRMESIHGQGEQITARSTARGLHSGGLFGLADHPRDDQNREYLVTGANYDIVGEDYWSGGAGVQGMLFNCEFTAIGKEHSFRPQPIMRKPFVQGPQTAMVVGKAGEEIWTDKYGRVLVRFHWRRDDIENDDNLCWVRVSQSWAGKGWGTMFIPRIGMEVVVAFLEGDPDRPLVTGCVYNSSNMPPYALPAEQTKSTIKTESSKGGAGFNEIRFEDKKDNEEIFIQAEKDYNRVVKNNDTLKVGFEKADKGDQTITIKNDQSLDVGNDRLVHVVNDETKNVDHDQIIHVENDQKLDVDHDQTITVKNDLKLDVGNDRSVHVTNDQTTNIDNKLTVHVKADHAHTVDKNQTVKIDGDQAIKVGKTCVIEATSSIELKVGGSSIKIEPAKITIKSVQIAVESSATMDVKAGAVLTIEGALVKIN